jgi:hypothetical protein
MLKKDAYLRLNAEVRAINDGPADFEDAFNGITYSIRAGYALKVPRGAWCLWMGYPDELWESDADREAEKKRVRMRLGEVAREQYGTRRPNLRMEELPENRPEPVAKPRRVEADEPAFPELSTPPAAPTKVARAPKRRGN